MKVSTSFNKTMPLNKLSLALLLCLSKFAMAYTIDDNAMVDVSIDYPSGWFLSGETLKVNGILNVNDGAHVSLSGIDEAGTLSVASGHGKSGSMVVSNDGQVDLGWKIFVGRDGGSGNLTIASGGHVNADKGGNIGAMNSNGGGRSEGEILITGRDSTLTSSGEFHVGGTGTGRLIIEDEGQFIQADKNIVVGNGSDSIGIITITGLGSQLLMNGTSGNLFLGFNGQGTLEVKEGGYVSINKLLSIGQNATGNGSLIVTGLSSKVEVGSLRIGGGGSDVFNKGQGSVTISDGALLTSEGNIAIGEQGVLNIGAAADDDPQLAGHLLVERPIILYGAINFNHTNDAYEFSGNIMRGSGEINQIHGTTELTGENFLFTGNVNITGGTLQVGSSNNLGSITAGQLSLNGGALQALGDVVTQRLVELGSGHGKFIVDPDKHLTLSSAISGAGNLIKEGAGSLILGASNSYTGATIINAGTLQTAVVDAFRASSAVSVAAGAILDLNNFNQTANHLSGAGSITLGSGTLTAVNDLNNDTTFGGVISGSGSLIKEGDGNITLSNLGNVGALAINAGGLYIHQDQTVNVTGDVNVEAGTTLGVDMRATPALRANVITFGNDSVLDINNFSVDETGNGITLVSTQNGVHGNYIAKAGGNVVNSIVTLDAFVVGGVRTEGNDIVARTSLVWDYNNAQEAHGTFNVLSEATLANDFSDRHDVNASSNDWGWNGQDLTKKGAGTLILNGQNTYSGHTFANEGQLIIGGSADKSNAFIRSDVTVANQALLGGHGSIFGRVAVQNGGTISPGTSIGTLSAGSVHFESGSHLVIEADANGADKLVVSTSFNGDGQVMIDNGASLTIKSLAGVWQPMQRYVIVTADGGITGTFTNVNKDTVFLNHEIIYNAHDILLDVIRNNVSFVDIGHTYNQKQTAGGIEHLGLNDRLYQEISWMTDEDQVRAAYDSLSGEIHASAKAALLNNAKFSRNAVYNHLAGNAASSIENGRELWINFWGQKGDIDGNSNAAQLKNEGWGFLLGTDLYNNGQVRFGLALGYEQNDLKVNARNSKVESEGFHLMAYGQAVIDQFELSGGLGYNWQKLDAKRDVYVGTLYTRNNAKYNANVFQIFMKGQYNIEMSNAVTVSPYLALAYQHLKSDSFRESGTHTNLVGKGSHNSLLTTSLGLRARYKIMDRSELFADLAWRHHSKATFSSDLRFNSAFNTFNVKGVSLSKNTGVINVGGSLSLSPDTKLSVGYEGEFGNKMRNNSFKLQFQHRF